MSFTALTILVGCLVIAGAAVVDYLSRPHGDKEQNERHQH